MCGVVAVFSPSLDINPSVLDVMRDQIKHRGPDNGTSWIDDSKRVGLAHRRLAVIDITEKSNQPMMSQDGRLTLSYNGEVYNYLELKQELVNVGVEFKTESDTEVVLEAIREWGYDAIEKFNGMFALTMWNSEEKEMFVARDRFGEKPLFIGKGDLGFVAIASEMKAILIHPQMKVEPSPEAIKRYCNSSWYEDDELTFFQGIERVLPAHAMIFNEKGVCKKKWRYWTPNYEKINTKIKSDAAISKFKETLENSVKIRMRSDVDLGSSLSGGIDSSTIVGLISKMREGSNFKQNTFSAIFSDDPTMSEESEIDEVVRHTKVKSYKVEPTPGGLIEESMRLHWHQEEPFLSASIYLQWCVARSAKENNTTVLLDGQGADELLAGYQYHFKQWQLDQLDNGRLAHVLLESDKFTTRLRKAGKKYSDVERRFNPKVAYTEDELHELSKNIPPVFHYAYDTAVAKVERGSRLRRTVSEALSYNSIPMLLRYADRNSMAFSRENRLPFLDNNLVDLCISLPDKFWIDDGWQKWILRSATEGLIPESIRWRADKVGYASPLDIWLRADLKDWAYERCFDKTLLTLPGYCIEEVRKLWDDHQGGKNNSWLIWRWISLSEWFVLLNKGYWKSVDFN